MVDHAAIVFTAVILLGIAVLVLVISASRATSRFHDELEAQRLAYEEVAAERERDRRRVIAQYDTERRWLIEQLVKGPPIPDTASRPWPEGTAADTEEAETRKQHLKLLEEHGLSTDAP